MRQAVFVTWWFWAYPAAAQTTGSASCAPCHKRIYEVYSRTPMARSSGVVGSDTPFMESFVHSTFTHDATGYRYTSSRQNTGKDSMLLLEIEKGPVRARMPLRYFVGSGAVARSYLLEALLESGRFLFEAPVAYYASGGEAKWDLAPGYSGYAYPFLTRPIQPGCLSCHATGINPVAGAQNRYGLPPFREGGIGCERCHGPGDEHIAGRPSRIVNPSRLAADRRDSICAQCHLQGEVRVMRPGKDWNSFRPGDRLEDVMTIFVKAGGRAMTVTGHGEALALSACKRMAGDRLWCGSCHDPHSVPRPADRVAWFRSKCLACHQTQQCRENRTARQRNGDDCTGCHLPKNPVVDAQHIVHTDHSIPRRPQGTKAVPDGDLIRFGGGSASARDQALAAAIIASRSKNPQRQARAIRLLESVERETREDVEALAYLAELYRNTGRTEHATRLYERALKLDPSQVTSMVGLGAVRMERSDYRGAIRLWQDALARNAGLLLVRTNMALAYSKVGEKALAVATLQRTLELNPGFPPAMDLLKRLEE